MVPRTSISSTFFLLIGGQFQSAYLYIDHGLDSFSTASTFGAFFLAIQRTASIENMLL